MTKRFTDNGEFVFRKSDDGSIDFVGDFDGLYRAVDDPWSQSMPDERMAAYYAASRSRLLKCISKYCDSGKIVEVGCGLGQVCELINREFPAAQLFGVDISDVAVAKARKRYPSIDFLEGDVRKFIPPELPEEVDVIILNQILWYILDDLGSVILNALRVLRRSGYLIISNAFFVDGQSYGKEIIDGFQGLRSFLCEMYDNGFLIVETDLFHDPGLEHDDGLIVIQKV